MTHLELTDANFVGARPVHFGIAGTAVLLRWEKGSSAHPSIFERLQLEHEKSPRKLESSLLEASFQILES